MPGMKIKSRGAEGGTAWQNVCLVGKALGSVPRFGKREKEY